MNKIIIALFISLCFVSGIKSQSKIITYTATSNEIFNPERGFYVGQEIFASNYQAVDLYTLNEYKAQNFSLFLYEVFLDTFLKSSISSTFLSSIQNDLNLIRIAGLKAIIRFTYSDSTDQPKDASKTQILEHINQLKPILVQNFDIIAFVQAGFVGTWGEWYFSDNFGTDNLTPQNYADRKQVFDALIAAVPKSRMVQVRTPIIKQKLFSTKTALQSTNAFDESTIARTGHHNDCFMKDPSDAGTYENKATELPYLEQETKYTVMGGETCGMSDSATRYQCTSVLAEMLRFHWTYLNYMYEDNTLNKLRANGCFQDIKNKLGYRFELVSATLPLSNAASSPLSVSFVIKNSGFAALVNKRVVYLVMRNTVTNTKYSIALKADPRFWTNGLTTVTESLTLPLNMAKGYYELYLNFPDASPSLQARTEYSIRLANDAIWESSTGYNKLLHTINIF